MLNNFFRHTCHKDTFRPAPNLHSRNLTTALQDPDGAAAFCHHHNIMTNVSFNSPKLEEKYRPSCKNELNATNDISFAEDSLDCMTTKYQNCVIIVICTKSYYRTL